MCLLGGILLVQSDLFKLGLSGKYLVVQCIKFNFFLCYLLFLVFVCR